LLATLTESQRGGNVTIGAALQQARSSLPFLEARALLCHALELSPAQLLARPEQQLTPEQDAFFRCLVARRIAGEPVAYLTGSREFFGFEFKVGRDVLIPRVETELLVETALEKIPLDRACGVLDLGAGCGNIAIALALQRALAEITAVDISEGALQVARENLRALLTFPNRGGGWGRVRFVQGNWLSAVKSEKFDVIVSNPPYVAESDPHLEQGDLRFEPSGALVSGTDGLDAIREIVALAPNHLNPDGWLIFEHGFDQSEVCLQLLRAHRFGAVFAASDLAGIPRVAGGRLTDAAGKS
jgi:release factor glutamine methyltransferase